MTPDTFCRRIVRRRTRRAHALSALRTFAETDPAAYDAAATTGELDESLVDLVDIMAATADRERSA